MGTIEGTVETDMMTALGEDDSRDERRLIGLEIKNELKSFARMVGSV